LKALETRVQEGDKRDKEDKMVDEKKVEKIEKRDRLQSNQ
jgi:hypothetical protein